MTTWLKKSLAVLVAGSIAWDPAGAAMGQPFSAPHPQPAAAMRLSAEALNALAVWQHATPTQPLLRHRLTALAVSIGTSGAIVKTAVSFTAQAIQHAAPVHHAAQAAGKMHQAVSVYAGDSPWRLAARWLGDGNRWREFFASNPSLGTPDHFTLLPGQINLPPSFDFVPAVGHAPTIVMTPHVFSAFDKILLQITPELIWVAALSAAFFIGWALYRRSRTAKSSTQDIKAPARGRSIWKHPFFRPVMAGVQLLLILTNSFLPSFAAVKTFTDIFKKSTDQIELRTDLNQKTAKAAKDAKDYVPPFTVGAQTIFEKYEGTPDLLKFVGPNLVIPRIPLPHTNPLASANKFADEHDAEHHAAEKRKAVRDYLDILTPAAAAYAQAGVYVDALTRQLDKTTDTAQRDALTEALNLAWNQKNEALNKFKEVAKLPQTELGADEEIAIPAADQAALKDLNEALNKPDLAGSGLDPDSEIAGIDARVAARRDFALAHLRWWDRLPSGFSASLAFNLLNWGLPPAWLSNSTLILPQFDSLDAVKDQKAIEDGKASLLAAQTAAQSRLEQAFLDWKAANATATTPDDPIEAAQQAANAALTRWNALSDMNHFNVTPDLMTQWQGLSDDDRKVQITAHVRNLFREALPAYESWEAAIKASLPKPGAPETTAPGVTVDPLTIGGAGAHGAVPAYNGQAQLGKETGLVATNVRFARHAKKIAAITAVQTAAQARLDKKDLADDSVGYWEQSHILLTTAIQLAEEKRDPIVLNPGFQQSRGAAYSYPWIYFGLKPLETKIARTLWHLVHKPKTPETVARSIVEAKENFADNLAHTLRQVQLNEKATEESVTAAQDALYARRALPLDADAMKKAGADLAAAQDAYLKAHETYLSWQVFAHSHATADPFWSAYFPQLWEKTPDILDSAEYAVRAALRHEALLKGDVPSIPTGASWDSNTFIAALIYDPAPGKLKNSLFTGINFFTNYDPLARGTAKDNRADEEKKAHDAVIAARQDAALQRATAYPELAVTVTGASRLETFAALPGVSEALRSQALALSRQASEAALKQSQAIGVSAHAVKPLAHDGIHVLDVPHPDALAAALNNARKAPEDAAHKSRWIVRLLKQFNVPINGIHYFQVLGPVKQVGTQETIGAWDPKNLPGLKGANRRQANKDAAAKNEAALADAMSDQELFYRVKGLYETLHGRAADGKTAIPGLLDIHAKQAAHTEKARLELMRAIDNKADDSKIFTLFHRWRKSADASDALLKKILVMDGTLRAVVLVLNEAQGTALGITEMALPAVPVVTLDPEPVSATAPLKVIPAEDISVIDEGSKDSAIYEEPAGVPATVLPVLPTSPAPRAVTQRKPAAAARRAEEARQTELARAAEAARQADLDHQAELARDAERHRHGGPGKGGLNKDTAEKASPQNPAPAKTALDYVVEWSDWGMDNIYWVFSGTVALTWGLFAALGRRRGRRDASTRLNSHWLGLSVIGLALPMIGGSLAAGEAIMLGGFILQLLASFLPDRKRPEPFHERGNALRLQA